MSSTNSLSSTVTPATPSLGSEIYSGSASFGRITAFIGAIFTSILAIVMIIIGIVILVKKNHKKSVIGTVKNCRELANKCCTQSGPHGDRFHCSLTISYEVDNHTYTTNIDTNSEKSYSIGSTITLYYDPDNPSHVSQKQSIPRWTGGVLIGIALFLVTSAWLWVWLTRKYKFAAASQGVGSGLSIISGGRF